MKFRKKPVVIEAITFQEFVDYGRRVAKSVHNGMPWSFEFEARWKDDSGRPMLSRHHVTHEDDDCYLIPTLEGTMRFNRGDMLITGVNGEIYPCKRDIFDKTYERAE